MFSVKTCLFLFLFVADVFFCIKAIKEKNSKAYIITKPLLMPTLLLTFIMALPTSSAGETSVLFVELALGLHTIGDILLLVPKSKSKVYFYSGMVCFFLGHIMYTASFLSNGYDYSKIWGMGALLCVIVLECIFCRQLLNNARKYCPLFFTYTLGLVSMAIVITSQIGTNPKWYAPVISLIGNLLFSFSDYCICRREIRKPIAGQMVIMPTYIAAQILIVAGILVSLL